MKTIQEKEFKNNDILLCRMNKNNIIVMVNDKEQLEKFTKTGSKEDMPLAVMPYTDEKLKQVISTMKQIESYQISNDGNIDVHYVDGTNIKFDSSNESVIKKNFIEQRMQTTNLWNDIEGITDEEKESSVKIVNAPSERKEK